MGIILLSVNKLGSIVNYFTISRSIKMKKELLIILSILQICAGILMLLFGLQDKQIYFVAAILLFVVIGIINVLYLYIYKKRK